MPQFAVAMLMGVVALVAAAGVAVSVEPLKVAEACPPYWEEGSQNCPPPDTLIWVECPAKWPRDGKTPLAYGTPNPINGLNYARPDWTRKDFEREKAGFYLDCQYGPRELKRSQRKHMTIVVPVPVVQYGLHKQSDGTAIGFRVFRDGTPPSPEILFPESVSQASTLAGIGLGWNREMLNGFAEREGLARQLGEREWSEILTRPGLTIEVVFDGQSRKTSEVILRATTSEDVVALRRQAVRQFGFDWTGEYGDLEKHWASADRRTVVEFWRRRDPTESASLRLIDKRGAEGQQ